MNSGNTLGLNPVYLYSYVLQEREEEEERVKSKQREEDVLRKAKEKEEREAAMEAAQLKEVDFATERTEAALQKLMKEAQEQGLTEMPEPPPASRPWPVIPPLPVAIKKVNPETPGEPTGVGINKKVRR